MAPRVILVTGSDPAYFEFLQGTILSIRDKPEGRRVAVGCFDVGLRNGQLQWLHNRVDIVRQPDWHFPFPAIDKCPGFFKGLFARPFLTDYFPGFDVYLWIDADAWIQHWSAVELFLQGAERRGLAIVPELDRGNQQQYGQQAMCWQFYHRQYELAFGKKVADKFHTYPLLNAGVFAVHRQAPHWSVWAKNLQVALQRSATVMTDQMALNLTVYGGLFDRTEMLPAWCNWTCHFGPPAMDPRTSQLVEPYLPHQPIGIVHLTGQKKPSYNLRTLGDEAISSTLRYPGVSPHKQSDPSLSQGRSQDHDYVSPGLAHIAVGRFFPNRVLGDKMNYRWPFLRRAVPHWWYVDRRSPNVGFLTTDESHLLYNLALPFKGKNALEIGCWFGWSTCHLALAGVNLDVVDPILGVSEVRRSVEQSLNSAGVLDSVNLVQGSSPDAVEQLARTHGRTWSLMFIDGNHEAAAPLADTTVCERYAAPDALIVFHDVASPDVAAVLGYLEEKGWHTLIYQTMQIMGIAWRGNVQPIAHVPDPVVNWHLPAHLHRYRVSGRENKPGARSTEGSTASGSDP